MIIVICPMGVYEKFSVTDLPPTVQDLPPLLGRKEPLPLRDGLYATFYGDGQLKEFMCVIAGKIARSLTLKKGKAEGYLAHTAGGQEFRGNGSMEDFGGRIEGPAYQATKPFAAWVREAIAEVAAWLGLEAGHRPIDGVFLNPKPRPFAGQKPEHSASGTASSDDFFPCVLGYSKATKAPQKPEQVAKEAAEVYLTNPQVEVLDNSHQSTGRIFPFEYQQVLALAEDDSRSLFVLAFDFSRNGHRKVVLGFCNLADRGLVENDLAGAAKFVLQGLARPLL